MDDYITVTITAKNAGKPIGQVEGQETTIKRAMDAVEEVKKLHPNAKIHVEVEV